MNILQQALQLSTTGTCKTPITKISYNNFSTRYLKLLHQILLGPNVALALVALQNSGFLSLLIPEIKDNINIKSPKPFKKVWPHILQVIVNTPTILTVRWAALFHDLGKAETFKLINDKVTFYNHEIVSANIFKKFYYYNRSLFTKEQMKEIHTLISHHGYLESYTDNWSDAAVNRFINTVGPYRDNLFALAKADLTTQNNTFREQYLLQRDKLEQRINSIINKPLIILPKGLGTVISSEFNIVPGKEIGQIKLELEKLIGNKELESNQAIDYYIRYLKEKRIYG